MPIQPEVAVPDVLAKLATSVAAAQRAVDSEWSQTLEEYRGILELAHQHGFGTLARAIAPSHLRITSAEIDVRMFVRRDSSGELRARLLSLGMLRRVASSHSVNVTMRCEIRQTPLNPQVLPQETRIDAR